jgi:hypothetical protein
MFFNENPFILMEWAKNALIGKFSNQSARNLAWAISSAITQVFDTLSKAGMMWEDSIKFKVSKRQRSQNEHHQY